MTKGFQKKTDPQRYFFAELKRRSTRDNSELMIGRADIWVPQFKNALYERSFASMVGATLLSIPEVKDRGVNQVFVFTKGLDITARFETEEWTDEREECGKQTFDSKDQELFAEALKLCKVSFDWLPIPQVA
jgi:hypothetical protein